MSFCSAAFDFLAYLADSGAYVRSLSAFWGSRVRPRGLALGALLLLGLLPSEGRAQTVEQPVTTVSEAAFRSRWVGPQADRSPPPLVTAPGEIEPLTDWATKMRQGLYLGSLRFSPGLGFGWAYSDRNYRGQATDADDDQTLYTALSLGLDYSREFGPWSLSLNYGGGYTYYFNQNFQANGSGEARNPLNQTFGMRLGHVGLRHQTEFTLDGSYGNGQNIQAAANGGGNTTTALLNSSFRSTYRLTEYLTTGTYANFNTRLTQFEDNQDQGSGLYNLSGGTSLDWLWSGKVTFGLNFESGISVQDIAANNTENSSESRQYTQLLLTTNYSITSKILLNAGLGANYVTDSGISDAAYTGLRPAYQFSISYQPTEKTSLRLFSNFDGIEIVPDFGFILGWQPRQTTSISASIYQDQSFSINTRDQFQVNRGFLASLNQRIFSKITLGLSVGYQQTENVSLSTDQADGEPYDYGFLAGSITWDLNSWLSWQTDLWVSPNGSRSRTNSDENNSETTASTGLNLTF